MNKDFIVVALDFDDTEKAREMVTSLHGRISFFKVGMQLFYDPLGMDFVKSMKNAGFKVMLDLKINDIPSTVAKAVGKVSKLGVDYLTVFCDPQAIQAAQETKGDMKLINISWLTSMELRKDHKEYISARSYNSFHYGGDGMVCAVEDVKGIIGACGLSSAKPDKPIIITPGIRPAGSATHDQKRVATPKEAADAGATHIVMGRPITQAKDPIKVIEEIWKGLNITT